MKPWLSIVAAGAGFAGASIAGLAIGIEIGARRSEPLWALGGLMAGAAIGAYSAFRLLVAAIR